MRVFVAWEEAFIPEVTRGRRLAGEEFDIPEDVVSRYEAARKEFDACCEVLEGIINQQKPKPRLV